MLFTIVPQDITKNESSRNRKRCEHRAADGGGVCGAIFKAAGESELQAACDKLAPIKTGDAVITPGFRLSANISSMLRGLSTEATIAVRKNSYAFAT